LSQLASFTLARLRASRWPIGTSGPRHTGIFTLIAHFLRNKNFLSTVKKWIKTTQVCGMVVKHKSVLNIWSGKPKPPSEKLNARHFPREAIIAYNQSIIHDEQLQFTKLKIREFKKEVNFEAWKPVFVKSDMRV
jgi:hypothetical protein